MDGAALQDKISRGMGRAARKLGVPYIVYRPNGPGCPINSRNRVIRLYAAFNAGNGLDRRGAGDEDPACWGVFDSAYTRPGDYLVGPVDTYFVSAQLAGVPAQCVRTNRRIDLLRAVAPGIGGYAGLVGSASVPALTGWPASILAMGGKISGNGMETRFAMWRLLLPQLPVRPEAGDVVGDDVQRRYVVGAAEESDLGWRLTIRQIAA